MRTIKKLDYETLKKIFKECIQNDFPLMERRPWFSIKRAWNRRCYSAYGYYEDDRFLAYATFYFRAGEPYILLDFYAVVPALRGQGIGSSFLKDLLPVIPVSGGIFGEAESVAHAENEEEKRIRKRRLSFYEKNGAIKTGIGSRIFGVDYTILFFPVDGDAMLEDYYDAVCRLYQVLYPKLYGRLCMPYREKDEKYEVREHGRRL